MTDDLDDLKTLMTQTTPAPDARRKAENLARASEIFAAAQGTAAEPRPTSVTGAKALWTGVRTMLTHLPAPRALALTTTAFAAAGLIYLQPVEFGGWRDQPPVLVDAKTPVPEAAEAAAPVLEEAPAIVRDQPTLRTRSTGTLGLQADGLSTNRVANQSLSADTDDLAVLPLPDASAEEFANAPASGVSIVAEEPVSTFSIDVDTASWSIIRSSLMRGQRPPAEAVRIEEMINYFSYDAPAPTTEDGPFRPTTELFETPWNADTQLLRITLQGATVPVEDRPPLNLVFLIDTSGSMNDPAKLPLLKQSLMLMLDELQPHDEVAIVAYAGSAGLVLEPTPATEPGQILAALTQLGAGGGTNGQSGLEQAYATAQEMAAAGEIGRVILATDGDFNVGLSDPAALTEFISRQRDTGTYLSVLGFGRGNLDDATMQALAQNGNGTAAYIDTLTEARKVLVDQVSGALFPIANDVKIQVEFNPAIVAEYRLLGYETRTLRREDFNNDRVDAGEIGAGHTVTALYEVTPVGSPARLSDPLRYGNPISVGNTDELAFLRLRAKTPGATQSELTEVAISANFDTEASADARFAAAIAGFGQLLRDDTFVGDWRLADAIALADAARGEDRFGYRAEAVRLMQLAEAVAE